MLLTSALTACGGSRDTPTDGPIRLSIFWWGGEKRAELTERALQLYSSRHPEVTFQVTWQGNTGYYDRLSSQAAGGNAPDLFQIDDNYLTEYAERDIVLDLTDHVRDNRLDLNGLPSSLASYGKIAGRTMAVAAAENTPGLIYNKSLVQRLGLPEPRIGMPYDEFIDWAVQVTDGTDGKVAGTMDPSADYKALWLWLREQGKELYRGRQLGFTEADLTRWFELWRTARSSRATPAAAVVAEANSGDVTRQLVATGKAATSFMWSNQLPELQKLTQDELGLVTYPGAPKAQWARASMYWAAFRGTRHPETVVDVINFLVNDVEAGQILGTERGLSANLSVRSYVDESLTDPSMKLTASFETSMVDLFRPRPDTATPGTRDGTVPPDHHRRRARRPAGPAPRKRHGPSSARPTPCWPAAEPPPPTMRKNPGRQPRASGRPAPGQAPVGRTSITCGRNARRSTNTSTIPTTTTPQQTRPKRPKPIPLLRRRPRAASSTSSPGPDDAHAATGTNTARLAVRTTVLSLAHHFPREAMATSSVLGATRTRRSVESDTTHTGAKAPRRGRQQATGATAEPPANPGRSGHVSRTRP